MMSSPLPKAWPLTANNSKNWFCVNTEPMLKEITTEQPEKLYASQIKQIAS